MRICITAEGDTPDSSFCERFGRSPYFIIIDTETQKFEALTNNAVGAKSGAGISSAQTMIDKGVSCIITGNMGPKAMTVINTADIDIYKGASTSVEKNIDMFNQNKLNKIEAAAPSHFGMRGKFE